MENLYKNISTTLIIIGDKKKKRKIQINIQL